MKTYYIDIGSSTMKVNVFDGKNLKLAEEKSIYFKNGFDKEKGISAKNIKELMQYFDDLVERLGLSFCNTKIFATGIFREIPQKQKN